MREEDISYIADNSNFIVCGYAFTKRDDGFISILNLKHPDSAMVINSKGEIIETNMDQIEQKIVLELSRRNLQFLEAEYA
jgi:hypothetical protein